MVWPHTAIVQRDIADLRAAPSTESELVDQPHMGENVRVLGEDRDWRYIQGPDQYFAWGPVHHLDVLSGYGEAFVVAVLLASIPDAPRSNAMVIARLPTGALIKPLFTSIQQPAGRPRRIAYEQPPAWRDNLQSDRIEGRLAKAPPT